MNRTLAAATVMLAAATLLAGCYADGTVPDAASVPEVVAETPTPEPVEIIAGAVVTDEQAAGINRDSADNAKAYQLADGTWVIVVKHQPVPDAVAADGAARSLAAAEADAAVSHEKHDAVNAFAKQFAVETGKRTVHVKYILGTTSAAPSGIWGWTVDTIDDLGPCGDPDTCIGKANAWISAQPDAANWTVLVSAH